MAIVVKKPARIGIDIDDVLLNTADAVMHLYNTQYGTKLTRDNWYDFTSMVPFKVTSTKELVRRVIKIMDSGEFENLVKPLDNSYVVLKKLKQAGFALIAVTGRPESIRTQTLRLLKKHFAEVFSSNNLYMIDHFSHDGEKATKLEVVERLSIEYFIDDQEDHIADLAKNNIQTILFDDGYKWNKDATVVQPGVRLHTWDEIEQYFL